MRDLSCIEKNLNSLIVFVSNHDVTFLQFTVIHLFISATAEMGFYVSLKAQQYACLLAYTSLPFHHGRTYFQINKVYSRPCIVLEK